MQNKHTKNWLIGIIVILMIVGATASLYAKTTFFKGTETLNIERALNNAKQAQASIFTARDFSKIIEENAQRINAATPVPAPEKSPCALGEITVWQYGKFAGCEKQKNYAGVQNAPEPQKSPGPKVTIIK